MDLYTIGHSNHPLDIFLRLLETHHIQLLVDIRSRPYSRFSPHFNKNALQQALQSRGIQYLLLGDSLGGRPPDPSCYRHGAIPAKGADYLHEVDYPQVMKRPWFIAGIGQLLEAAGQQTTSIMCSEEDPARCHRHHLIARYLLAEHPNLPIWHIRKDSSLVDARSIPFVGDQPDAGQLSF